MYGVVLWSDHIKNRAVIWCEDHGDLAFFNQDVPAVVNPNRFVAGDLVLFEVTIDREIRLAHNPRLVAADEYPTLTQDLKIAKRQPSALRDTEDQARGARPAVEKIIPFASNEPRCPSSNPVSKRAG